MMTLKRKSTVRDAPSSYTHGDMVIDAAIQVEDALVTLEAAARELAGLAGHDQTDACRVPQLKDAEHFAMEAHARLNAVLESDWFERLYERAVRGGR